VATDVIDPADAAAGFVHAVVPSHERVLADCYGSADFREGLAAFLARRAPRWSGS
jgi:enoyl-CoA hydratase